VLDTAVKADWIAYDKDFVRWVIDGMVMCVLDNDHSVIPFLLCSADFEFILGTVKLSEVTGDLT